MTDQAQRTAWALQLLEGFIQRWVAPAMQEHLLDNDTNDGEQLRRAIRAIAPAEQVDRLGYAVYGLKPETRERRRESGFEAVVVSAVFDKPPTAALESSIEGEPWTHGVREGLRFFGICQLQQIST
jgi:hypothetical protein